MALEINLAATQLLEDLETKKEEARLAKVIMGATAKTLSVFGGEQSEGDVFINGPGESSQDAGAPVYVDGQYVGQYGEREKMSEEEFIKRTVAPPGPPSGDRWWTTTGSPRIVGGRGSGGQIVDFNDPDVL